MTAINVYLIFNGHCLEAFNFYKSVFGGEFSFVGKFGEMPPQEGMPPVPENVKDLIMHISLPISKETILLGSDSSDLYGKATHPGNNFCISILTDTIEEADRLYIELSSGGNQDMPMAKTFWGAYFGKLTDRFGISWMVNVELKEQE